MSTVGWVVLTNDVKDGPAKWEPDWDGEVHTDKGRADTELAACRDDGYQCVLGEVRWDSAIAGQDDDDGMMGPVL